jgi:hypothetical protein
MSVGMIQFHPSNPFRPTNWRWELARVLSDGDNKKKLARANPDQYVQKAYRFLKELGQCEDEIDRYALMDKNEDLYGAYSIWQRGGDETDRHPMRYALEARILADEDTYSIANKLGITTGLVEIYEKVFFNIKDKISNKDYVMTCVMSPAVYSGLSDRDYDLLWKLFGYLYGPVVLDAFIHANTQRARPVSAEEVDAVLTEDTRSTL